jgi:hypothetical protein
MAILEFKPLVYIWPKYLFSELIRMLEVNELNKNNSKNILAIFSLLGPVL